MDPSDFKIKIPSECGQVYTGQTGGSVETRITEHHRQTSKQNGGGRT
jgi:hypothetical protein